MKEPEKLSKSFAKFFPFFCCKETQKNENWAIKFYFYIVEICAKKVSVELLTTPLEHYLLLQETSGIAVLWNSLYVIILEVVFISSLHSL